MQKCLIRPTEEKNYKALHNTRVNCASKTNKMKNSFNKWHTHLNICRKNKQEQKLSNNCNTSNKLTLFRFTDKGLGETDLRSLTRSRKFHVVIIDCNLLTNSARLRNPGKVSYIYLLIIIYPRMARQCQFVIEADLWSLLYRIYRYHLAKSITKTFEVEYLTNNTK